MPKKKPLKSTKNRRRLSKKVIPKDKNLTKFYIGIGVIVLALILFFKSSAGQNFLYSGSISPSSLQNIVKPTKIEQNLNPIKIAPELLADRKDTQPPQRILIPKLNIDLYVVEAKVINGFWEISETNASHGVGSSNPGNLGNIVISAHAREGMFGGLKNVQRGEQIYLLTKDSWHRYAVSDIKEVTPNQLEVISPTSDETLTLYTCTGFTDEKRLIVIAKPSK